MHGGTEGHIKKLVIDNHNAWTKFFSKDYSYIIDNYWNYIKLSYPDKSYKLIFTEQSLSVTF